MIDWQSLLSSKISLWTAFNAAVLIMLALDLGVFHRKIQETSIRESLIWSAVWIGVALLFNIGLYYRAGPETGYGISHRLPHRTIALD